MRKAAVSRPGGAVWGLSCVESQVLSLIEQAGWEPACCYAGSLVSYAGLYGYFITQNRPYAYFDLAVKAQDWLKSVGALTISRLPLEDVLEGLEGDGGCLLPLTVEAMRRLFGKTPWRPDHYLLVRREGDRAVLYDDIQPVPVQVPLKELPGLLAGPGLLVRLVRPPEGEEKAAFRLELARTARRLQRQDRDGLSSAAVGPGEQVQGQTRNPAQDPVQNPARNSAQNPVQNLAQNPVQNLAQNQTQDSIQNPAQNPAQDSTQDLAQNPAQVLTQVRDMTGMARLLAKRLICLLSSEGQPVDGLQEAAGELDHTYARMQYALRRGRGGTDLIPSALDQVCGISRRLAAACAGEGTEEADGKIPELYAAS